MHTRRWKLNEKFADFYCSRKQNEFGRFISIETVQGGNRSVIIMNLLGYGVTLH